MAIHIALAGNPNCGKTTMFNALTGANQYVGNWPGVTVEKKTGKLKDASGEEVNVTDLPGVYSLSPYTLEEVVTRDFILKENPDVIVDLVDATNIERNLYLTTQLIETGIPVVIALNMCDLLKKNGINIDVKALSKKLGCPIIETSALKKTGLKEVIAEAIKVAKSHAAGTVSAIFESSVEDKVSAIEAELPSSIPDAEKRWYAIKVLENDSKVAEQLGFSADNRFSRYTKELEKEFDDDAESVITDQRYVYIQKVIEETVKKPAQKMSLSDKIVVMEKGVAVQTGTPREIYFSPVSRYVASFVGKANYIEENGRVQIVRPEDVWMEMDPSGDYTVRSASFMGAHTLYELENGSNVIKADLFGREGSLFSVGDRVRAGWGSRKDGPRDCHL